MTENLHRYILMTLHDIYFYILLIISTFLCRFSGAEDVVMAFSRSEAEDRRQWPRPPRTSTPRPSIPARRPHPASPRPARDPQQQETPQTQHWWAQEKDGCLGRGKTGRGKGKDTAGGCTALRPGLFPTTTPPHASRHTHYLRCTRVGHCGLKPRSNKADGENTHRLCGWLSNVVFLLFFFFCGRGGFCFVSFKSVLRL